MSLLRSVRVASGLNSPLSPKKNVKRKRFLIHSGNKYTSTNFSAPTLYRISRTDAESKLLNMDEYKSFLTHETPKAVRGNGLENGYSLSVATGKEDENFETRVLNGFSAENGLAIFTANGENVQDISAGIHRSFTARMHSAPSSESLNDVSPTTETSVTFPGSSMKSVGKPVLIICDTVQCRCIISASIITPSF